MAMYVVKLNGIFSWDLSGMYGFRSITNITIRETAFLIHVIVSLTYKRRVLTREVPA